MDVRHEEMAKSVHRGDVAQPADGTKLGSEVDIALASTEPNVIPLGSEQPAPSPVAPTADIAEPLQ